MKLCILWEKHVFFEIQIVLFENEIVCFEWY